MTNMSFGGDWTEEKLEILRRYLLEYTKIMNKQSFRFAYIDAFAGTGYRTLKLDEHTETPLLPEFLEDEPRRFLEGSARIALQVEPRFHTYIFIEKEEARYKELQKLKNEFADQRDSINLVNQDANDYLFRLCSRTDVWRSQRAVLFLDPFGMQVSWTAVQSIALTRAIDMWYLFPIGAVNRLLKKDGKINEDWQRKLNEVFGDEAWYDTFYRPSSQLSLFGEDAAPVKNVDFDGISAYVVRRLKTIFPGVATNPKILRNRRGSPLFLLCFAAANENGAPIAIRIAEYILKHI